MLKLLAIDVSRVDDTLRAYYFITLYEMMLRTSTCEKLQSRLTTLVETYHCQVIFDEVPLNIEECLSPITGKIGMLGGRLALNNMIGEYAARLPTRQEMIARFT